MRAVAKGESVPDDPETRTWLVNQDVLDNQGRFLVPMVERGVRENK